MGPITSEIVFAYSQCPRKAYLLLFSGEQGIPHDYHTHLMRRRRANRTSFLSSIAGGQAALPPYDPIRCPEQEGHYTDVTLASGDMEAACDLLTVTRAGVEPERAIYEPTIAVGTHSLTSEQKIELTFVGYVLGQVHGQLPAAGRIVGLGGRIYRLNLQTTYKTVRPSIDMLKAWAAAEPVPPPPVILNKHCPACQFRALCRAEAERTEDLSLLDRMTPKVMQRLHRRGIFTVTQLSYLYRPRRKRQQPTAESTLRHVELQALALRTGKTYVAEAVPIDHHETEIYLDIEGVPDQESYYLVGALVSSQDGVHQHSFWADRTTDEKDMFREAMAILSRFPDAPIYHYGRYEATAMTRMAQRSQIDWGDVQDRMVNVTSYVHGRIYFPVRSNGLKDIGRFLGASWSDANASGLQSLAWRYSWEESGSPDVKGKLIRYNQEDCAALRLLVGHLRTIAEHAPSLPDVDFADRPKRVATGAAERLHDDFEGILRSAHLDYDRKKVTLRRRGGEHRTRGRRRTERTLSDHRRRAARRGREVRVPGRETCPRHPGDPLQATGTTVEKVVVDLAFNENGCRKVTKRLVGPKAYCPKCHRDFSPPQIARLRNGYFGHGFQAWVIYQRLALRMPYRSIRQAAEDQFNETITTGSIINFIGDFSAYYRDSEIAMIERMRASPFIHVDETRVNVQGADQYIWVFTDGSHVVFRLTKTREAGMARDFLSGFEGVLVTDFFSSYDSIDCRKQK
ncbi:MAG: TM0106 family RecB-like putative nuclease, partial [Chloroflexi bacterium]|nr:TM0106 family RecB-like putative nuclease [Chloroflexota bacterium]